MTVELKVRAFQINPYPDTEHDTELEVESAEIEDGTLWVYVKAAQG